MGIVSLLVEFSYLSVVCICTKSESEHVTGMRNFLAQHNWRLRYCDPPDPDQRKNMHMLAFNVMTNGTTGH